MTAKPPPAGAATPAGTPFVGELTGSIAPMPKKGTLRARTSLTYQTVRFARINLRMIKMIRKSHTH
jgi:hypothetical protein